LEDRSRLSAVTQIRAANVGARRYLPFVVQRSERLLHLQHRPLIVTGQPMQPNDSSPQWRSTLPDPKASLALFRASDRSTPVNGHSPKKRLKVKPGDSGLSRVASADPEKVEGERLHLAVANWRCRPIAISGDHDSPSPKGPLGHFALCNVPRQSRRHGVGSNATVLSECKLLGVLAA